MTDELDTMPIKELRALARQELSTGSRLLRKAEIIPVLRKYRESKAEQSESTTPSKGLTWESLTAGTIVRVGDMRRKSFYFMVTTVDPTYTFSPFAWVQGKRVTRGSAGGYKPAQQVDHAHCAEGERMEILNIASIVVVEESPVVPARATRKRVAK